VYGEVHEGHANRQKCQESEHPGFLCANAECSVWQKS